MLVVLVLIQRIPEQLMVNLLQLVVSMNPDVLINVNGNGIPETELFVTHLHQIQTGEKFLIVLVIANVIV
jgi:hypothetical protein